MENVESEFIKQRGEGRMWFGVDGKGIPRQKTYLSEREGILKKAPKHDKKNPSTTTFELLQLVRTAQKAPHVGDMKFKRSGAASAAPLRSLSGCARGCRSEYNDQSFHWLH